MTDQRAPRLRGGGFFVFHHLSVSVGQDECTGETFDRNADPPVAGGRRDGRHELLQLYADLELVFATRLLLDGKSMVMTAPDARSFGKKVQLAIKSSPPFKVHAELVPLRNLLAHAKIEVVTLGDELAVALRVADLGMAMNARIVTEKECKPRLRGWRDMLRQAIVDARSLSALKSA